MIDTIRKTKVSRSRVLVRAACAAVLFLTLTLWGAAVAEEAGRPFVRIAELEIDSAQLERFKDAAKEQIEAAVRVEAGVIALYAVSVKGNPAQIRVFEMYADENAYKAHLETPHFKRFREATNDIVKSRKLVDTVPIILGAKAK
jgi:quinol monooxygenase YgiN